MKIKFETSKNMKFENVILFKYIHYKLAFRYHVKNFVHSDFVKTERHI